MGGRVLVAVSGGVDSAVAAYLLKQQGYDVTAIMLRLYDKENSSDLQDAKKLCDTLAIPFVYPDHREDFRREVIDRFAEIYQKGETPNPCVLCNRYIKFPLVMKYAVENGFDYVATGHYASVRYCDDEKRYKLLRGKDRGKDQSYVLFNLTQNELSRLILPLGDYSKEQVRHIALSAGLNIADKRDSQDICFISGNYYDYLRDNCGVSLTSGDFIDKSGKVLGSHKGAVCYTRGQRKGLGLALPEPMYVLSKNISENTVTLGFDRDLYTTSVAAHNVNIISRKELKTPLRCSAKVRYNQPDKPVTVYATPDSGIRAEFDEPQRAVTSGQYLVLYREDEVIGGGVID